MFTQAHSSGTPHLVFEILMCGLHIPKNDLGAGLEGVLRKFADDLKLGAAVDTSKAGRAGQSPAIQV